MKCPNCGEEAVNINGRHICLDCGIEVSQGSEQPEAGAINESQVSTNQQQAVVEEVEAPPLGQVNIQPVQEAEASVEAGVPVSELSPTVSEIKPMKESVLAEEKPTEEKENLSSLNAVEASIQGGQEPITQNLPEAVEIHSTPNFSEVNSDSLGGQLIGSNTEQPLSSSGGTNESEESLSAGGYSPQELEKETEAQTPQDRPLTSVHETSVASPMSTSVEQLSSPLQGNQPQMVDTIVSGNVYDQILNDPVKTTHLNTNSVLTSDIEILPASRVSKGSVIRVIVFTIIVFLVSAILIIGFLNYNYFVKLLNPGASTFDESADVVIE